MDIQQITQEEANQLLNNEPPNYRPFGKFYVVEDDFTISGIDNSDGNAWTEGFRTLEECIAWLKGDD